MKTEEQDLTLNPEPGCPYCGHKERDAWEINFGPDLEGVTEVSCNSCGEDYFCSRKVSIYYTTQKLKAPNAKVRSTTDESANENI